MFLLQIVNALANAAYDPRVQGIIGRMSGTQEISGLARLGEIWTAVT